MTENTLQNVRIVLARDEKQVSVLKTDLKRRGADVIELPALEIEDLEGWEKTVFSSTPPAWTIVCNRGAADRLAHVVRRGRGQHEQLGRIAAIGESTAHYLEKYGLWAQRVYQEDQVDALIKDLSGQNLQEARIQIIAPEASKVADAIQQKLAAVSARVERTNVYRVHLYDGSAEVFAQYRDLKPDLVVFPSLKTITHYTALLQECGMEAWADLPAAAIGATTSKAAAEHGYTVVAVPKMHTMQGLAEAIAQWHSVH